MNNQEPSLFIKLEMQGGSQNLTVPQSFTEVFDIDDATANDIIQRNQHLKEKKLEFHSNH